MLRSTKVTVALLFVAYAIDYIDRLAINLALPLLGEEFDLDYSQRGLIISTFFIAYTLAQLPGGLLADRYGAVRMALIGWWRGVPSPASLPLPGRSGRFWLFAFSSVSRRECFRQLQ